MRVRKGLQNGSTVLLVEFVCFFADGFGTDTSVCMMTTVFAYSGNMEKIGPAPFFCFLWVCSCDWFYDDETKFVLNVYRARPVSDLAGCVIEGTWRGRMGKKSGNAARCDECAVDTP